MRSAIDEQSLAGGLEFDEVLGDVARGVPVVVVAEYEPFEPLLVCAAAAATPRWVAFMVRHSTGFLRVAVSRETCSALGLPSQMGIALEPGRDDQCVSVDAAIGTTTGISAHDRAQTLRLLGDPTTSADALTRPGHVIPVRCASHGTGWPHGGRRGGKAEIARDLVSLAECGTSAAYSEIVSVRTPTHLAATSEAREFAASHQLRTAIVESIRIEARTARPSLVALPA